MKFLQLNGAYCGYGKTVILSDVSLNIQEGDICLIEGENGIGKTTLGLSLLGLLHLLKGERVTTFESPSYVPQKNSLDPQYPIKLQTLVAMGQPSFSTLNLMQLLKNKRENRDILNCELKRMGLYEKRRLRFNLASGGELQRALVARAFIAKPDLVLFDEPFSNIDMKGKTGLKDILLSENQENNTTFMVIDHDSNIDFYTKKISINEDGALIHESN